MLTRILVWRMQDKLKLIAAVILLMALATIQWYTIRTQRQTINELIDLNHDKSEYIDGGCPGRFQGSEEMLSH